MNLSMMTDQLGLDFERALDRIAAWGVKWVDLRMDIYGQAVDQLDLETGERAMSQIQRHRLQVACLNSRWGSPFRDEGLNDLDLAEERYHLDHLLDLADLFKVDHIRINAYRKPNPRDAMDRPDLDPVIETIAERLRAAAEQAAEHGVTLVLENEMPSYVGNAAEARQVLETVSHPNLKACWDVANSWACGERPFPEGYARIKDWLEHVHVKGARGFPEDPDTYHSVALVGTDDLPWPDILATLREDGYRGCLALHPHHNLFAPEYRLKADNPDLEACRRTLQYLQDIWPANYDNEMAPSA